MHVLEYLVIFVRSLCDVLLTFPDFEKLSTGRWWTGTGCWHGHWKHSTYRASRCPIPAAELADCWSTGEISDW